MFISRLTTPLSLRYSFYGTRTGIVTMSAECPIAEVDSSKQLTKKALKRIKNKEGERKRKQIKRANHLAKSMTNDSDIVEDSHLRETSYYFQNGLRKVYPYFFTFSTFAKGRWYKRSLLEVFMDEFHYKSRDEIEVCFKSEKVKVNGKPISKDYNIRPNDFIENLVHRHELPVSDEDITILENSADIVVINKPSSIPVHPCGRYRHNSCTHILAKEHGLKNLRSAYRLDRLTSGVMIFSKTEGRANQMACDIKNRLVEKEYVARVQGEFPSTLIECRAPIAILSPKIGLWKIGEDGKEAHTTFERISYNGICSVVRCRPHTGRTHQIRVHLQYLGYPIVNDPMYRGSWWGPLAGKDGQYGRPEQDIIDDLFRIHSSDQFIDNSNIDNSKSDNPVSDKITDVNDATKIQPSCSSCTTEINDESEISPTLSNSNECIEKPLLKRSHCETLNETVNENYGKIMKLDSADIQTSNHEQSSVLTSEPNNEIKSAEPEENVKSIAETTVTEVVRCKDNATVRPQFDSTMLTRDEDCPECKMKYIDPSPKTLVMHLHAYRYKGPTWEYRTPLPNWAAEDWTEENTET